LIERDPYVRLGRKIVNLVGPNLFYDAPQTGTVAQVSVMKLQSVAWDIKAGKQVVDAAGREAGATPYCSVNLIALVEKGTRRDRSHPAP
jgi:hypothetical protein